LSDPWYDTLARNPIEAPSDSERSSDDANGATSAPHGEPDSPNAVADHGEVPHKSNHSGLATIVRLQSSELERLARENERLMDRIETLLRLQEREQVLRQQMQAQIGQLSDRIAEWQPKALPGPTSAADRQRDEEEIKPVLLAMLDLLERMAPGAAAGGRPQSPPSPQAETQDAGPDARIEPRPEAAPATAMDGEAVTPAAGLAADPATTPDRPNESSPAQTPDPDSLSAPHDAIGLPEILRRPIEDLTTAGRADTQGASSPSEDPEMRPSNRPARPSWTAPAQRRAPSIFAWTSIFS
jgi:hypothetical protein